MKKINFFGLFLGIGAVVFALGMNYRYAIDDYGIKTNTISMSVLANGSDSGGGSGETGTGGIPCNSTIRIELKKPNKYEPKIITTLCNGCCNVYCYEASDSGKCTVSGGPGLIMCNL